MPNDSGPHPSTLPDAPPIAASDFDARFSALTSEAKSMAAALFHLHDPAEASRILVKAEQSRWNAPPFTRSGLGAR